MKWMWPFPKDELVRVLKNAKSVGVIDKDISFGYEGTVFTNVNSALLQGRCYIPAYDFVGGIGGRDISVKDIEECYKDMMSGRLQGSVKFIGSEVKDDQG